MAALALASVSAYAPGTRAQTTDGGVAVQPDAASPPPEQQPPPAPPDSPPEGETSPEVGAEGEPGAGTGPVTAEPGAHEVEATTEVEPGADVDLAEDVTAIEDLDLEDLLAEPVVTSSGGAAEERVLAFANVYVITRDQIVSRGYRSLADALVNVPGLYLIDDFVLPSIGVRGATGGLRSGTRIVKVMINGVPVHFRPDLTAFIGPELLPIDAIERIEVVQGPLSALYGANAFIATINVITRRAADGTHAEVAGRVHVVEGNGGYGASAFVSAGGENRSFVGAVSSDYIDRSGLRIGRTFSAQDPVLDRYAPLLRERTTDDVALPTSAFLELSLGDERKTGRVTLQGGAQRLDSMAELQVSSAMSHRSRVAIENFWSDVRYERRFSDQFWAGANVGLSHGEPTREYRLFLTNNRTSFYEPAFEYTAVSGGVSANWSPLGERLSLRLGVDGELDSEELLHYRQTLLMPVGDRMPGDAIDVNVSPGEDLTRTITQIGVGLQATSVPIPDDLPGLRLAANVRVDSLKYGDVDFDPQLSFRAGIVYRWSDALITKLIAGRAFQTPSGVLMFARSGYGTANNIVGNATLGSIGIQTLRPQTATGAELVTNVLPLPILSIGLGLYYQAIEDSIGFTPFGTEFVAENRGTLKSFGALLDVRAEIAPITVYTTFTGQAQIDGEVSVDPLERFPAFFGTAGVDADVPEAYLRGNVSLRWAMERASTESNTLLNNFREYELPAYALVDVTLASRDVHLWGGGAETRLSASIRNVLDTRVHEPGFAGFDIPTLGRSFWFELRQAF